MMRAYKVVFGSRQVEFESAFDIPGSVERLRAATRGSMFFAFSKQEAVGTVTGTRVSLKRVIPLVGNSFKPFFRGHFTEKNGRAVLIGRFGIHGLVKIFVGLWFGLVLAGSVGLGVQVTLDMRMRWYEALFGPGLLLIGAGIVWLCTWFARNDEAWLSELIDRALRPTQNVETIVARNSIVGRPIVTRIVAAVLGLLGALKIWIAVAGARASDGPTLQQCLSVGYGLTLLVLGLGIFQRRFLAWRAGLLLLAGVWCFSTVELFFRSQPQMGVWAKIAFSMASFIVTCLWVKWWHAQRGHFRW